jgi:DNA-binding NarL/FixJ family response regulator
MRSGRAIRGMMARLPRSSSTADCDPHLFSQIARKLVSHFHQIQRPASEVDKLAAREQELIELLAKGHSDKELSDQLGIMMNTIRLPHIYEKLHVQPHAQAVLKVFAP